MQSHFPKILTFLILYHQPRNHEKESTRMVLYLSFHKILTKKNETSLYVDQTLQIRPGHFKSFFFQEQKNELSHYQTTPQQYHSVYQNLQLYIYHLKTFVSHLKTNNPNLHFLNLCNIFKNIIIYQNFTSFFSNKNRQGTLTLCRNTQSGLVSIIDFSLSFPLLG